LSDDGEPSGTSGPPALAVLRGAGIGDVVLVITRYFGGTKLGTGGLVTAYGNAARMAVDALETMEKVERRALFVTLPYGLFERTKRFIEEHEGLIEEEHFSAEVELLFQYPVEGVEELRTFLRDASAGKVDLQGEGD
jgi:uncharacterized YigZ family protein